MDTDVYWLMHFLNQKESDQPPLRLQGNIEFDPNDEQDYDELTIPEKTK
jgi:hypothetical protein